MNKSLLLLAGCLSFALLEPVLPGTKPVGQSPAKADDGVQKVDDDARLVCARIVGAQFDAQSRFVDVFVETYSPIELWEKQLAVPSILAKLKNDSGEDPLVIWSDNARLHSTQEVVFATSYPPRRHCDATVEPFAADDGGRPGFVIVRVHAALSGKSYRVQLNHQEIRRSMIRHFGAATSERISPSPRTFPVSSCELEVVRPDAKRL